MQTEYPENMVFFEERLCEPGQDLSAYPDLFDFHPAAAKRGEFSKLRYTGLALLRERLADTCQLNCAPDCDPSGGLHVDVLIPLSANVLNKALPGIGTSHENDKVRKTPSQGFGSNLVLACVVCSSLKMNRIPEGQRMREILHSTSTQLSGE
jgi:hypothetical protein